MINRIESLKKLGKFNSFYWRSDTDDFDKLNLLFGYNGSGKTTLSNVFRLFSHEDAESKSQLYSDLTGGDAGAEAILHLDGKKIKFDPNKNGLRVYTFNSDFVADHVFDGNSAYCKSFDSAVVTEDQLKNPDIKKIEKKLSDLKTKVEEDERERATLDSNYKELVKRLKAEFGKNIPGPRITKTIPDKAVEGITVEESREQLDQSYKNYEISTKQDQLKKDIESLQAANLVDVTLNTEVFREIMETRLQDQVRKVVMERIHSMKFNPEHSTLSGWFEDGYNMLEHVSGQEIKACPLCSSDISDRIEGILSQYSAYFDDTYGSLKRNICNSMSAIEESIEQLKLNKINSKTINGIGLKYYEYIFEEIPEIDDTKSNALLKALQERGKLLVLKKKSPQMGKWNLPTDTSQTLNIYNAEINITKARAQSIGRKLGESTYDTKKVINTVKKLVSQQVDLEFDQIDSGGKISRYRQLKDAIADSSEKIEDMKSALAAEIAKLKSESRYINAYLKKLGLDHFSIQIKEDTDENIEIHFKGGAIKTKLRHSLSESEKTTLAFAYFLSKFKYEVIDNTAVNLSDTIVVIDDPISSLDENRLHVTACILKDHFLDSKQLFVLSHNMIFMKFLSNLIGAYRQKNEKGVRISRRRDYFISSVNNSLEMLPEPLSNYKTTYFQKLREILEFDSGDIDYQDAKKFIPNHVRTVLETFLSFKFSIMRLPRAEGKYLSPGLDRFIKLFKGNSNLCKDFPTHDGISRDNLIGHLEDIKRITDPQAHGSPQDIDDVDFISEQELEQLAKRALNVIGFLDIIHFQETRPA